MSKFPGLCIGGPLDGKLHQHNSPRFTLQKSSGMGLSFGIMEYTYIHVETEEGVHFWIQEGETPKSILTRLAVHYMTTKALE